MYKYSHQRGLMRAGQLVGKSAGMLHSVCITINDFCSVKNVCLGTLEGHNKNKFQWQVCLVLEIVIDEHTLCECGILEKQEVKCEVHIPVIIESEQRSRNLQNGVLWTTDEFS